MSRIGHIDEFEDNSSTSVQVDEQELLVVKRGGELFLYKNNCPHASLELNPMGGSVSSSDGLLLTCQHHGAEFLSDTGECVSGPCLGDELHAVPFTLADGDIYLD
ncbi:MAG: Rieske (2Fe-2S) protein [Parahaliea sp.]